MRVVGIKAIASLVVEFTNREPSSNQHLALRLAFNADAHVFIAVEAVGVETGIDRQRRGVMVGVGAVAGVDRRPVNAYILSLIDQSKAGLAFLTQPVILKTT